MKVVRAEYERRSGDGYQQGKIFESALEGSGIKTPSTNLEQ